jgi:hypothetical protein
LNHTRPRQDERVETIDWLIGRPCNAAEQQDSEDRIVECPGEVTRDRYKHAAADLRLVSPEQRLRLALL